MTRWRDALRQERAVRAAVGRGDTAEALRLAATLPPWACRLCIWMAALVGCPTTSHTECRGNTL